MNFFRENVVAKFDVRHPTASHMFFTPVKGLDTGIFFVTLLDTLIIIILQAKA